MGDSVCVCEREITLTHSNGVHFCANVLELYEK